MRKSDLRFAMCLTALYGVNVGASLMNAISDDSMWFIPMVIWMIATGFLVRNTVRDLDANS